MPAWARLTGAILLALAVQAPQFKSGVEVARFDVVVLDKDRHPITGLTQDDFRVTEDGKPLRIAGFEAVTIPAAAPAPATATATVPAAPDLRVETVTNHRNVPGRLVVIVMDRSIPYEQGIVTARRIANAAIDALGPNDLAAVVFTSGIAGNRLQDLTANRDRLRAAVTSAQMGTPTDVTMTPKGDLMHTGPNLPMGECYCGVCTMQTLAAVADAIASVEGYRKMILFIGRDLPISEDSSAGRAAGCQGLFREAREKLLLAIDRGNVTVHTLNPRGLETGAVGADAFPGDTREPASERLIREGNLKTLAAYTGGRSIVNLNQPEQFVPAIFEESRTYYVLAIERAPAHRNGQPHTVRIEVASPAASVVSRMTYLDAAADATKKAPADPLERALGEVLPRSDLPLHMTLGPGATKNASLDVTLATPLTAPARADVVVGVFDEFGKHVGSERARVDLPASAIGDAEWKMHLNPKPGHYEVRAAVRIGTVIGSITGYVDVTATPPSGEKPAGKGDADKTPVRRVRAEPSAETAALLQRAAAYLEQYSDPANGLLLEERYNQQVNVRPPRIRELRSELLILPDATEGWLQFRDVMAVDGKPVADRADRLMQLFASPTSDARNQARRIADESARYNISGAVTVSRTLNQPLAALLFLRGAAQPRSAFQPQGTAGSGGQRLSFFETGAPTLIGGSEPSTGDVWIDPSSGRILRSELHVVSRSTTGTASATIRVQFAYDPKTRLMLPTLMQEHYVVQDRRGSAETIDGDAKYSNPRQFKVTTSGS